LYLLLEVRPARSFEDLRRNVSADEPPYTTFADAARALGIVKNDNELDLCLKEAVDMGQPPAMLRGLFALLITAGAIGCGPTTLELFERYSWDMGFEYCDANDANDGQLSEHAKNSLLLDLEVRLEAMGTSTVAMGLPAPQQQRETELERERARVNVEECLCEFTENCPRLTEEQRAILERVQHLHENGGGVVFVQGRSGRGKTLLLRTIAAGFLIR